MSGPAGAPAGAVLLVLGAGGYVGRAVVAAACVAGWSVVAASRTPPPAPPAPGHGEIAWRRLDVTDRRATIETCVAVRPAAVINAAAALGDRGGSAEGSWRVNAVGAGHVAVAAATVGARLVHVSSDAVHGGRAQPYTEADEPTPTYPYGATKAAAEAAVTAANPDAALVRTSLVVSCPVDALTPTGPWPLSRHERHALALVRGETTGVLFTDEIRCPVAVDRLAGALVRLAGHDHAGVLNVAGPRAVNRYEFGVLLATRHGLDPAMVPAGTVAGTGLTRPAEIRLDSSLAVRLLGG